jgi:hypothetical protein
MAQKFLATPLLGFIESLGYVGFIELLEFFVFFEVLEFREDLCFVLWGDLYEGIRVN